MVPGKPNDPPPLAEVKTACEIEKLDLEKQVLRRQLSGPGPVTAWLQATAVPIALLGAAITLYLGVNQIRQSEQNRAAERFDKALSRLASRDEKDRLTGLAGLRLFLGDANSPFQLEALQYLVNALYQ